MTISRKRKPHELAFILHTLTHFPTIHNPPREKTAEGLQEQPNGGKITQIAILRQSKI